MPVNTIENNSFSSLNMASVFSNDFLEIYKADTESLLEVIWKRAVWPEEYRQGVKAFIRCAKATNARLVLIDYCRMPAPTLGDQAWAGKYAMPMLRRSEVKRLARLLSVDIFQNLALDNIFRLAQPLPYQAENFSQRATALQWLLAANAATV